jgi:hypothetical protein
MKRLTVVSTSVLFPLAISMFCISDRNPIDNQNTLYSKVKMRNREFPESRAKTEILSQYIRCRIKTLQDVYILLGECRVRQKEIRYLHL